MNRAFNARLISTFGADRLYRVYLDRGELFFIRIGGQAGVAVGVAAQFGLLGAMVLKAHKKRSDEKLAARILDLDRQHPSAHLSGHKHNFHAATTAVRHSSLEPAAAMGAHGEHFGRWRFQVQDGKEILLQLETLDDMRSAFELLPSLGAVHASNVVWDSGRQKFTKRAS